MLYETNSCGTKDCGPDWNPPLCGADSACQASATDPCSFSCIKKPDCPDCLYEYMIGDKLYCDCNRKCDPPRYDMYWSCDNTEVNGTSHQHGFARVPAIQRDSANDLRKITLMPDMDVDDSKWFESDYSKMIRQDGKMEVFGNDDCTGTVTDGKFVDFRLF